MNRFRDSNTIMLLPSLLVFLAYAFHEREGRSDGLPPDSLRAGLVQPQRARTFFTRPTPGAPRRAVSRASTALYDPSKLARGLFRDGTRVAPTAPMEGAPPLISKYDQSRVRTPGAQE